MSADARKRAGRAGKDAVQKRPLSKRAARRAETSFSFRIMAGVIVPLWSLAARYRFVRKTELPARGGFILCANHLSSVDPVAVGVAVWRLGRIPRFLAKASLFKVPVIGRFLRASGQIPVDRGSHSRRGSGANPFSAAHELLRRGRGVIVYPEGTFTDDPGMWPMRGKTGAVRLALETGIPLYPLAHWGSQDILSLDGRRFRPFPRKTISIAMGEPLDLSRFQGEPLTPQLLKQATEQLMQEITALLALIREEPPPAPISGGKASGNHG